MRLCNPGPDSGLYVHSFIQHLFESYNVPGPGTLTINKIFPLSPQIGTGELTGMIQGVLTLYCTFL